MDDFFDDELKQMEEREAAGEELITEAISLTDPIKSLSKGCLAIPEDSSLREVVNQFQKENIGCAILTKDEKIRVEIKKLTNLIEEYAKPLLKKLDARVDKMTMAN